MRPQYYNRGFTLIETLIYMALVMFVMGAGVVSAFYLIDGSERDNAETNILVESEFLLRKIDWALTGVETIYLPLPGIPGDTLQLDKVSEPQTIEISLDSGTSRARLKRGTGSYVDLTGDRVKIENLEFTLTNNIAPKPDEIKIKFTANGKLFEMVKYLRK